MRDASSSEEASSPEQLERAEQTLCDLLADAPADGYARLLLGRTLQRRSRHAEAATHLRLAAAMGVATD
ncbi:hypothetical protein [Actinomycetospora flava]|uniref:Tetratricopeptide repeat protein n=1 Tax=Actinomycetospora flava TaxID=3129232 RepID=A0ABU8M8P8_9PSEU